MRCLYYKCRTNYKFARAETDYFRGDAACHVSTNIVGYCIRAILIYFSFLKRKITLWDFVTFPLWGNWRGLLRYFVVKKKERIFFIQLTSFLHPRLWVCDKLHKRICENLYHLRHLRAKNLWNSCNPRLTQKKNTSITTFYQLFASV